MQKIGFAIPICEQDKDYLQIILPEIKRMGGDVSWLANDCSEETIKQLKDFERTVSIDIKDGSFNNCMRNYPMEALKKKGYEWCIQMDMDETWESDAPGKLRRILKDQKLIQVRMGHVWEKNSEKYITTDWASIRDRIYNLKYEWYYMDRVVAGAKTLDDKYEPTLENIWMIHWGYSTQEKRLKHKARWDANHGHSAGKNPYGQWKTITQEGYEPKLIHFDDFLKELNVL